VRTGAYALAPEETKRRLRQPGQDDALAAAHFRLAEHLHRSGAGDRAQRHFDEAARLRPDHWTYRRQEWALADEQAGQPTPMSAAGSRASEFWAAVDALDGGRVYPEVELDAPKTNS